MPSAAASRRRVPEGRFRSTRCSRRLYSATVSARTASFMASPTQIDARRPPAWPPATDCRRDRQRAQAGAQQGADHPGSPPASPQRLTSRPVAARAERPAAISRSTAGFSGSARSATAADVAAGGGDVLGEVVGADREEIGVELVDGDSGGRHLDHDAEFRADRGQCASRARLVMASSSSVRAASSSPARSPSAA